MESSDVVIDARTTLSEFADRMLLDRKTSYAVTEDGEIAGVVSLNDVKGITSDEMETKTVGDTLGEIVRVSSDSGGFDALMSMNKAGANSALVEKDGDVIGVISRSGLGSVLEIRKTVRVPQ
jgi:CBS domain-containing protein